MGHLIVINVGGMTADDCYTLIKEVRQLLPLTPQKETEIQCLAMERGATVEYRPLRWKKK